MMRKSFFALCAIPLLLFAGFVCAQEDPREELLQAFQETSRAKNLKSAPDGVTLRRLPDGGFQLFSIGSGTYDLDDVDDIASARKTATLNAKTEISKFISDCLSSKDEFESRISTVTTSVSADGKTTRISEEGAFDEMYNTMKSSSSALLKGVTVLLSTQIPGRDSSGTCRVVVGVSSKTIETADKMTGGFVLVDLPKDEANSGKPAVADAARPLADAPSPAEDGDKAGLPPGWIVCIGVGGDRHAAVLAALIEGVQQVYGLSLQNDERIKQRMQKFKNNKDLSFSVSKTSEQNTMTETIGFVREFRIIDVKELKKDNIEAKIQALIVNPRAGGAIAILLDKPQMPQEKLISSYEVGPNRRLSGHDIADEVDRALNRAFSRINQYLILNDADLASVIAQQDSIAAMVKEGLAPAPEMLKAGQLLTADYILTSRIEDLKYTHKVSQNPTTKKFETVYKMSIRLSYKWTNVTTGQSISSDVITETLDHDEIKALLAEDDDADLLSALLAKLVNTLSGFLPKD